METLLIRERYKIVQVLHAQPDYAFAEAVDIQDRQTPACLVNVYEGAWLPRYAEVYAGLEGCPAFQGAFLQGESLVAVFQSAQGLPIDREFYRDARWGWRDRLEFDQLLLHQALTLCGLPPEIGCAALFSENVLVDVDKRRVDLRYFIRPLEGMTPRELTLLAADQVEKILLPRFSSADGELAFLKQLRRGEFASMVPLYAAWRRALPQIEEEYQAMDRKNAIHRACALVWKNIKRKRR